MKFFRKWLPQSSDYEGGRLFCLDLLRGLDMFLLTIVGPLVYAFQTQTKLLPPKVFAQFDHAWGGFTLWDIIMPLFIFMCGAAIPYALSRRLKNGQGEFWRHVVSRVVMLWVMGGCVQGNWLSFNLHSFSPFANTLQAIAIGYLATAAMMCVPSRLFRILLPILLAGIYTIMMGSNYERFGNLAQRIDMAIFKAMLPADNPYVAKPSSYTWFFTSLMFAAMTMTGFHAAEILRSGLTPKKKSIALFVFGCALLVFGLLAEIWIPCIKHVYSLSFTAQAMGWSVLALVLLYVVTDVLRFRRGMSIFLLYGQCALSAYLISHLFGADVSYDPGAITKMSESILRAAVEYLGNDSKVIVQVGVSVLLTAAIAIWRKIKMIRD